jgi:hypothetical protein
LNSLWHSSEASVVCRKADLRRGGIYARCGVISTVLRHFFTASLSEEASCSSPHLLEHYWLVQLLVGMKGRQTECGRHKICGYLSTTPPLEGFVCIERTTRKLQSMATDCRKLASKMARLLVYWERHSVCQRNSRICLG